ncbi:MAG TPA: hypothetical protein VFD82_12185 [Planctomycetota bacterium]|nr:hypothetical protein [Planctomycetota bacterium]
MPTRLSAVLFAFLLPVAGCLEVESMEVRVVADSKNDRLDIMIVSRGVWSSAKSDSELASDLAKLRKCREVAAVPVPGMGVMDFTAQDDDADWQRWRELIPFLDIEAGAFFTDEQGRLSFYQFLRVHRPKEFAAACSRIARTAMLAEKKISAATRALLEKAANEEWPVVIIDGAGFGFRRPLADEDHRTERAELARDVERSLDREAKRAEREEGKPEPSLLRSLFDNDLAIVRRAGVTEYLIGTQGSEVCDYVMPGKAYEDNLMKAFTADEPRPPAVTQAIIDKQFAAFHAREARLPPAFAEQKKRAQPAGR